MAKITIENGNVKINTGSSFYAIPEKTAIERLTSYVDKKSEDDLTKMVELQTAESNLISAIATVGSLVATPTRAGREKFSLLKDSLKDLLKEYNTQLNKAFRMFHDGKLPDEIKVEPQVQILLKDGKDMLEPPRRVAVGSISPSDESNLLISEDGRCPTCRVLSYSRIGTDVFRCQNPTCHTVKFRRENATTSVVLTPCKIYTNVPLTEEEE